MMRLHHVTVLAIVVSVLCSGIAAGQDPTPTPFPRCCSVDVEDYGAKGDGKTDDSKAIQDAIDAVGAAGGGTVCFWPKIYRCANTIVLNKCNVALRGAGGKRGTMLLFNSDPCQKEPRIRDGVWVNGSKRGCSGSSGIRYCSIRNIHIEGRPSRLDKVAGDPCPETRYESPTGHGLLLSNAVENSFEDVFITGFNGEGKYGICFERPCHGGNFINTFTQVDSAANANGLWNEGNVHTFITCRFQGNKKVAVKDTAYGSLFLNCEFASSEIGVDAHDDDTKTYIGCYWEGNGIHLRCRDTTGLTVHGGHMIGRKEDEDRHGVYTGIALGYERGHPNHGVGPKGVTIQGLTFSGHYHTNCIHVFTATDLMLSGLAFPNQVKEKEIVFDEDYGVFGNSYVQGHRFDFDGAVSLQVREVQNPGNTSGTYTYSAGEEVIILADATRGDMYVNLPPAAKFPFRTYWIKKVDPGGANHDVTIQTDGAEKIDEHSVMSLSNQYEAVGITNNGTNWFLISQYP